MPIRKLQRLGENPSGDGSYGVCLDKGELEYDGLIQRYEEEGEVSFQVTREGEGVWRVEAL